MAPALFDLLCVLGRSELSSADRVRVENLVHDTGLGSAGGDHAFLPEAAAAGLVPLAYRHLIARRTAVVSTELADQLTEVFRTHVAHAFRVTRRLRELLEGFEKAGVEVRPYKGPVLAIGLYGNFAMRTYSDLDLLVRPRDAEAAGRCLVRQGLQPVGHAAPGWHDGARARRHDEPFLDAETGTLVELHWALSSRLEALEVDVDWLFQEPVPIDLLGRPVAALSPERLALSLAVHGSRHVWERLAWLVDFAELVRAHPSLDWSRVRQEARRLHFERAFATSLVLACSLLGAPRPDWVKEDAPMRTVASAVHLRLARGRDAHVELAERARWGWRTASGLSGRAAWLWRLATTPSLHDAPNQAFWPSSRFRYALPRGIRLLRTALSSRRGPIDRA